MVWFVGWFVERYEMVWYWGIQRSLEMKQCEEWRNDYDYYFTEEKKAVFRMIDKIEITVNLNSFSTIYIKII